MLKSKRNIIYRNLPLIFFILSTLFFVFIIGALSGHSKYLAGGLIDSTFFAIADWRNNYNHNLRIDPGKHIGKTRKLNQLPFIREDGAWPGVTLVTSFIDNEAHSGPGLVLLDMEGNITHEWVVSLRDVFPQANRHDWDATITGAELLNNGDVIFNFNEIGTVKLDWCSNVKWKVPLFNHHNIFIDEDDNIWTAGKKPLDSISLNTQYPPTLTITNPDVILKLSSQGELLKEINILDVILKSDLKGTLFANGQQQLYHKNTAASFQFTHMNDVEVLSKKYATNYPQFEAGDIMVSLRNLNLIMVIDANTHLAKWWMIGPFLRQHDPDFDGQGHISIFDNMGGGAKDDIGFASRIILIDPVTRDVATTYRADPHNDFYTAERGNHQILPNGNILVTETLDGRIVEVDRQGEIVWQKIMKFDEKRVIHPYQAQRYQDLFSGYSKIKCN